MTVVMVVIRVVVLMFGLLVVVPVVRVVLALMVVVQLRVLAVLGDQIAFPVLL